MKSNECSRSLNPFYIVTYYIHWVKTSCTDINPGKSVETNQITITYFTSRPEDVTQQYQDIYIYKEYV